MEYAVCGKKAKSLDPVVLHQLNKKYAGIVGDYAIVEVVNDNEKEFVKLDDDQFISLDADDLK